MVEVQGSASITDGDNAIREVMAEVASKPPAPEPAKMFPVKLLYNYQPFGAFEAIGWHKPAVEKKNAAGQMIVVEPAAFIEGEIKPAPYPGVGFPGKVWAGSTIGLPREEAIKLINSRRAERADAIPA